jgi:hypothetical protein
MGSFTGIAKLQALEQIKLLKARRDRAADTKDWALYESLHAPDHRSIHDGYPAWTSAAEMIANVSRIMAQMITLHHSHTPEIEFDSPTKARGIWAMKGLSLWKQGAEDHWFLAFGHYFETYERRNDSWLFTSRELKYYHTMRSPGAVFPPKLNDQ